MALLGLRAIARCHGFRGTALQVLVRHLPELHLNEVLTAVDLVEGPDRLFVPGALAHRLPEDQGSAVISDAFFDIEQIHESLEHALARMTLWHVVPDQEKNQVVGAPSMRRSPSAQVRDSDCMPVTC